MKIVSLGLALAVVVACGGCFHAPSPYARQLSAVIKSYKAIDRGTSRSDIETRLGPATRTEETFTVWETRYDAINAVVLKVRFDAEARARQIELTRQRGTQLPGFQTSSSFTTSSGTAAPAKPAPNHGS